MHLVTHDWESFWSPTHSLTKMNPFAYVMHPDTEIISLSLAINDDDPIVVFGEDEAVRLLRWAQLEKALLIAHNNEGFDALMTGLRLGFKPAMWGCTLAMARPIFAKTVGVSLKRVSEALGVGVKNDAVLHETKGKRLADFTPGELARMRTYNGEDTVLCRGVFHKLRHHFSAEEMFHIDCNIRMVADPKYVADMDVLEAGLKAERARKWATIHALAKHMQAQYRDLQVDWNDNAAVLEFVSAEMSSAPKFSRLLESRGVEVPMKPSPTPPKDGEPRKMIPALSKTDEDFTALVEHEDELVAAAAQARLAVKSTLVETRIETIKAIASVAGGLMPVPIKIYGADTTGRDAGFLGCNLQNLPRVTPGNPKPSDALRGALTAPPGYLIGVADQSGIELRMNHWFWGVPSTAALYATNPTADLYREFAAFYYSKPEAEVSKAERQFAKVCLAEGTLVLTNNGPKPIESVSVLDLVWDGVEWVNHDGPIYQGERDVIEYDGLTATPDHIVWTEDGRQVPLRAAAAQLLRLAHTGAAGLPVGFVGTHRPDDNSARQLPIRERALHRVFADERCLVRLSPCGVVDRMPGVREAVRCSGVAYSEDAGCKGAVHKSELAAVPPVRGAGDHVRLSDRVGRGSLGYAELGAAARQRDRQKEQRPRLHPRELEVADAPSELGEHRAVPLGSIPPVPADVPGDPVRGHHPQESDVLRADGRGNNCPVAPSERQTKRRVWDILNAGPRHRFTANDRLVSNCHLGLGFGAGAKTFRRIARTMGGLNLDQATAEMAVQGWRSRYIEIVQGWRQCGDALRSISRGQAVSLGPDGIITTTTEGFRLPSGRLIRYPDLRYETTDETWDDGRAKSAWVYAHGRHKAFLTPAKVDENLIQALARDSVFECAFRFFKLTGFRPIMRLHDELIYMFPKSEAEALLAELQRVMRTPPSWGPTLVLWSEGDVAERYSDAK